LSPAEVEDLLRSSDNAADKDVTETKVPSFVSIGATVRIIDGAFANFEGVIEEIDVEHGKLKLMVSIFGRSTPVELEFWQVGPDEE
jgi:transcriptional antiterminator NusG